MKFARLLSLLLLSPTVHAMAAPSPGVIRVKITTMTVFPRLYLITPTDPDPKTGLIDALADYRQAAQKSKAYVTDSEEMTADTMDGVTASVSHRNLLRYETSGTDPQDKFIVTQYAPVGETLTATPRLNANGIVTLSLDLRNEYDTSGWRELSPPKVTTDTITTTRTFKNGDTLMVGNSIKSGWNARLYFATVTVLPTGKA